jgi:hypothetical protein
MRRSKVIGIDLEFLPPALRSSIKHLIAATYFWLTKGPFEQSYLALTWRLRPSYFNRRLESTVFLFPVRPTLKEKLASDRLASAVVLPLADLSGKRVDNSTTATLSFWIPVLLPERPRHPGVSPKV